MSKDDRSIIFDADSLICLFEWEYYGKLKNKLGNRFCVSEYVADNEVKYYKQRGTGRKMKIELRRNKSGAVPRIISPNDLNDSEYEMYLTYFQILTAADAGERETFALAWVLDYHVCSRDTEARELFYKYRPVRISSRHMTMLEILRSEKIIK